MTFIFTLIQRVYYQYTALIQTYLKNIRKNACFGMQVSLQPLNFYNHDNPQNLQSFD